MDLAKDSRYVLGLGRNDKSGQWLAVSQANDESSAFKLLLSSPLQYLVSATNPDHQKIELVDRAEQIVLARISQVGMLANDWMLYCKHGIDHVVKAIGLDHIKRLENQPDLYLTVARMDPVLNTWVTHPDYRYLASHCLLDVSWANVYDYKANSLLDIQGVEYAAQQSGSNTLPIARHVDMAVISPDTATLAHQMLTQHPIGFLHPITQDQQMLHLTQAQLVLAGANTPLASLKRSLDGNACMLESFDLAVFGDIVHLDLNKVNDRSVGQAAITVAEFDAKGGIRLGDGVAGLPDQMLKSPDRRIVPETACDFKLRCSFYPTGDGPYRREERIEFGHWEQALGALLATPQRRLHPPGDAGKIVATVLSGDGKPHFSLSAPNPTVQNGMVMAADYYLRLSPGMRQNLVAASGLDLPDGGINIGGRFNGNFNYTELGLAIHQFAVSAAFNLASMQLQHLVETFKNASVDSGPYVVQTHFIDNASRPLNPGDQQLHRQYQVMDFESAVKMMLSLGGDQFDARQCCESDKDGYMSAITVFRKFDDKPLMLRTYLRNGPKYNYGTVISISTSKLKIDEFTMLTGRLLKDLPPNIGVQYLESLQHYKGIVTPKKAAAQRKSMGKQHRPGKGKSM